MMKNLNMNKILDKYIGYLFFICAIFSIFAVFSICIFIFVTGFPAFKEIGVFKFVFGSVWNPSTREFGIFPMIVGSIYSTAIAIVLGGGIGIFSAIYLSRFCPKALRIPLTNLVSLLAAIPSIVYGFFGMIVLVPFLKTISPTGGGEGLLAASIILSIMIIPTIVSICKTNIDAVPSYYYDAAVALGSTHPQAVFHVVVPAAKSSIFTAVVLAIGRAIGETMAVIMVAGNAPFIPESLFSFFRTMTINIVLEMGYATGLHRQSLIATGFVLLVFIFILNLILNLIKGSGKYLEKQEKKVSHSGNTEVQHGAVSIESINKRLAVLPNKKLATDLGKYLSLLSTVLVVAVLLFIVGFILSRGLPNITFDLLAGNSGNEKMTLKPAVVSTFMLLFLSLAIALPIGIFAAIYMVEYAKSDSKIVYVVRIFTESLSGIPSIVFGLFGMIVFSNLFDFGRSLLSGSLTLSIIVLPAIIRQTEETLMAIPVSIREGSLALGASKVRTIFLVVLPCAVSGISTSVILSIGRIVGETAALIYTAGAVSYMPSSYMSAGSSFAVMMYMFASEGLYVNETYATASVLLIIVFILNIGIFILDEKSKKSIH